MTTAVIYGSCVSRDAMTNLTGWDLSKYFARQSFISSEHPTSPDPVKREDYSSQFQYQQLRNDFRGNMVDLLDEYLETSEVILIDLVDERQGVLKLADGGYVTNNYELAVAGTRKSLAVAEHLNVGTDEHFALWQESVAAFLERLDERGARHKLLLVAPGYAERCDDGTAYDFPQGRSPQQLNSRFVRYWEHLEEQGVASAKVSAHRLFTSPTHRWGPAPFHYNDASEYLIRRSIRATWRRMQWPDEARQLHADALDCANTLRELTMDAGFLANCSRLARKLLDAPVSFTPITLGTLPALVRNRGFDPLVVTLTPELPSEHSLAEAGEVVLATGDLSVASVNDIARVSGVVTSIINHGARPPRSVVLRGIGSQAALAAAVATVTVPDSCQLVDPFIGAEQRDQLRQWWGDVGDVPDADFRFRPLSGASTTDADRIIHEWSSLPHVDGSLSLTRRPHSALRRR